MKSYTFEIDFNTVSLGRGECSAPRLALATKNILFGLKPEFWLFV